MSEKKKVVSIGVAIALGVICVTTLAILVWVTANYTTIIRDKDSIISSEHSQIGALTDQANSLNATYRDYMSTHSHADSEYNSLQSGYDDYVAEHQHTNSEYDSYVASHQHTDSEYDNYVASHQHANSEYDEYVNNHQHTDSEYDLLQSIANLGEQQTILDQYTVNQGPDTHTFVSSFQCDYAGYVRISSTSTTSNAFIIVEYWYQGQLFSFQKTLGTSGDAYFCVLPTSIAIYVGNTNSGIGATHTITATYHY